MADYERNTPARHAASDLRRLKLVGFALPVLFLIGIEAFRFLFVENDPVQSAEHVAIAAVAAIGIVVFASLMFRLIERAEAQVIRQNRELTAINAVSTAVQGELAVEQIIDAALNVVVERTGATEASVVVFGRDNQRTAPPERKLVRAPHASLSSMGEAMPHLVEIPLAHGSAIVGRMRLHLAEDAAEPDLLATATLNNIGHQLASSIEIGQLIDDLQRREIEDRGLYDVLMRISNQKPLAETLDALGRHACQLLDADQVQIRLSPQSATLMESSGTDRPAGGLHRTADGGATISISWPAGRAVPVHANPGPIRRVVTRQPRADAWRIVRGRTR